MQNYFRLAILASLLFAWTVASPHAAEQPQVKFDLFLIWGTDGEKPEGKDLKEVDANFTKKFRKIFKWKNYFEVKRVPVALAAGQPARTVKMSDKCSVVLAYSEKHGLEVELIGEGKSIYKTKQAMPLSDHLVLAGDDINATAWFVVIKPQE